MSIRRDTIKALLLETLEEIGEDFQIEGLDAVDESTRLFGARSPLDSMGLVNVIAEIEDKLSELHGVEITLADEKAMSSTHSPFRSVGSCIDYIERLVAEESA